LSNSRKIISWLNRLKISSIAVVVVAAAAATTTIIIIIVLLLVIIYCTSMHNLNVKIRWDVIF